MGRMVSRLHRFHAAAFAVLLVAGTLLAQTATPLPRLVQQDGRYALFVDGAPYLMLGAQVHNSSAFPAMLPQVWPVADALHLNTLEVPIYWETFETSPGHYDATFLKTLLTQAREHHVHLVLLWFGTWKNGSGHYLPQWMKLDEAHYPHVIGKDGRKVDSLSPHSPDTLKADTAAFTALMHAIKLNDPQHTVLMVQVENESGTWGSVRDYSPAAEKLFNQPVPQAVLTAMHKTSGGIWREVFGTDADEYFHAYSISSYIGQVAAAGKRELALPMYINVAARNPLQPSPANTYESGGATDNVIPIWKAAAPAIDILAPDIYDREFDRYTALLNHYHRPDNPLLVPENSNRPEFARYFFAVLGHEGIGFAPFGMDNTGYRNTEEVSAKLDEKDIAPFALTYEIFAPMQREIARLNFEGKLKAVAEDPAVHEQTLDFGAWKATIKYGMPQFGFGGKPPGNTPVSGGAMVAQLGPNEFLITAEHARLDFTPADPKLQRQFLIVEEGTYVAGRWTPRRIWNGDQTDYGLNFAALPQVLRVKLATY
jgi:beta-galactosidase GanA